MSHDRHRQRTGGLESWLEGELCVAAHAMLRSVSATGLTRRRPGFGQVITPRPGSVVASREFGDYDPEPDYFFHWLRDSALVMDALRELMLAGIVSDEGHAHFADFIRFSLSLGDIDGPKARPDPKAVSPTHRQFLRPAVEFEQAVGEHLLAEARYNPDGTLDIIRWARPQLDGPALRALSLMRYWPLCPRHDGETKGLLQKLIRQDLTFVARHWREASYDLWEEELGGHYYTRLVHLGALVHGMRWLRSDGAIAEAARAEDAIGALTASLDAHWSDRIGTYRARSDSPDGAPGKDPDIAIILGVVHADLPDGAHSVMDPKVLASLHLIERTFAADLAINRQGGIAEAPALGRFPGDVYYGGGAWYVATLAAAEFHFRLAARAVSGAAVLFARGDAFLDAVKRFTPVSGELSEQFDRERGEQTSARNLAWSYAAFITACRARTRAVERLGR